MSFDYPEYWPKPPPVLGLAIHEAGHAVADLVLGCDFDYATIEPRLVRRSDAIESWGHVLGCLCICDRVAYPEREIVASLCGPYAEKLYFPSVDVADVGCNDLCDVEYIRENTWIEDPRVQRKGHLEREARALVKKYRHAILLTANELIEHKTIFPCDVWPFIEPARPKTLLGWS
jgi:hypothetical protein